MTKNKKASKRKKKEEQNPKDVDFAAARKKVIDNSHLRKDLPKTFVNAVTCDESDHEVLSRKTKNSEQHYHDFSGPVSPVSMMHSNYSFNDSCDNCKTRQAQERVKKSAEKNDVLSASPIAIDEISAAVLTVAHKLSNASKKRKQVVISDAMTEVLQRVTDAYEHYGVAFNAIEYLRQIEDNPFDMEEINFDNDQFEKQKEKKQERQEVDQMFYNFDHRFLSRMEIMEELNFALGISKVDPSKLEPSKSTKCVLKACDEELENVERVMEENKKKGDRLSFLFNKLMASYRLKEKSMQEEIEEGKEIALKKKQEDEERALLEASIVPYDETKETLIADILADPNPFQNAEQRARLAQAGEYMVQLLQDALQFINREEVKTRIDSGIVNFNNLWDLIKSELGTIAENEYQQKEEKEALHEENIELKAQAEYLQNLVQELQNEIVKIETPTLVGGDPAEGDAADIRNSSQLSNMRGSRLGVHPEVAQLRSGQRLPSRRVSIRTPSEMNLEDFDGDENIVMALKTGDPSDDLLGKDLENALDVRPSKMYTLVTDHVLPEMEKQKARAQSASSDTDTSEVATEEYAQEENKSELSVVPSQTAKCVTPQEDLENAASEVLGDKDKHGLEQKVDSLTSRLMEAEALIQLLESQNTTQESKTEVENFRNRSKAGSRTPDSSKMKAIEAANEELRDMNDDLNERVEKLKSAIMNHQLQSVDDRNLITELQLKLNSQLRETQEVTDEQIKEMCKMQEDSKGHQQMLIRMKKEHEKEVQNLKEHLTSEQNRFHADIRRMEIDHKKYVITLHKENSQTMRALNRFKIMITSLFRREELLDEASELEVMSPVNLLACMKFDEHTMSKSAKELLVNLESFLSRALLKKKIIMKDTVLSRNEIQKSLEETMDRLQREKDTSVQRDEKLNKLGYRNEFLNERYKELLTNNLQLEKEVAPYKDLLTKYKHLHSVVDNLQREKQESQKESQQQIKGIEKDRSILRKELVYKEKEMLKSKISSLSMTASQVHFSKMYIKKNDREHNIGLLRRAFEGNEITERTYKRGVTALETSAAVAEERLAGLMVKYIEFRRLNKLRATVERASEKKLERQDKFHEYLQVMEKRYKQRENEWDIKKKEFIKKRTKCFSHLEDVMKNVQETCGILLIEPVRSVQSKLFSTQTSSDKNSAACQQVGSWKDVQRPAKQEGLEMPDYIDGRGIDFGGKQGTSMWQMPTRVPRRLTNIATPAIMDMEVNPWKKSIAAMSNMKSRKKLQNLYLPPIATLFP